MSKLFELSPSINNYASRSGLSRQKHKLMLKDKTCCYCGNECTYSNATVEHTIPRIIKRLSFGKITDKKCKLKLSCLKCNNGNKDNYIYCMVGEIVSSNNIEVIKHNATLLCNLVRVGHIRFKNGKKLSIEELKRCSDERKNCGSSECNNGETS